MNSTTKPKKKTTPKVEKYSKTIIIDCNKKLQAKRRRKLEIKFVFFSLHLTFIFHSIWSKLLE